jgi:hypothetical protein
MDWEKALHESERLVNLVVRYVAGGGVAVLAFAYLRGNRFSFLTARHAEPGSFMVLNGSCGRC